MFGVSDLFSEIGGFISTVLIIFRLIHFIPTWHEYDVHAAKSSTRLKNKTLRFRPEKIEINSKIEESWVE